MHRLFGYLLMIAQKDDELEKEMILCVFGMRVQERTFVSPLFHMFFTVIYA